MSKKANSERDSVSEFMRSSGKINKNIYIAITIVIIITIMAMTGVHYEYL